MRIPISRRWVIFLVACLSFVLSQFYRSSIAVISPNLIEDLGLDPAGLGLVSAAFFYAFALMQIPIVLYLDRIGPRITMAGLTLVAVGGALVFATGDSLSTLVMGRVLIGAGMACNLMGSLKLITLWFGPTRFATLAALVMSIGTAGNIVSATPLVLLVGLIGWRTTFVVFAAVTFLVAMLFVIVVRDRPEVPLFEEVKPDSDSAAIGSLANVKKLFGLKDFWIISFGSFNRYGVFASVQALWAGPYLMTALQKSPVETGNLLFLMSVGIIVGSPVFGYLSDAVFMARKLPVNLGFIGKVIILVVLANLRPGAGMALLSFLFFGFGFFTSAGQIMYAHIKERMPIEMAGTAMTGINFFTMIGVAFFLQVLAGLMQNFFPEASLGSAAFEYALYFCALALGLSLVLYLFTRESMAAKPASGDITTAEIAAPAEKTVVNQLLFKTNQKTILAYLKSKADGASSPAEFSMNSVRKQPEQLPPALVAAVRELSILNAERPTLEGRSVLDAETFGSVVADLFNGRVEKAASEEIESRIEVLKAELSGRDEIIAGRTISDWLTQAIDSYRELGFFSRLDWQLTRWGSSDDIKTVTPETFTEQSTCMEFTTAWMPPVTLLQELANTFPSVRFRLQYRYKEAEKWQLIEFFPLMPWGY